MIGLGRVTFEVLEVVVKLQGYTTLVSQQNKALGDLARSLCELCPVEGPLTTEQVASLDLANYAVSGMYAVKIVKAREFIDDLGLYALQSMHELDEADAKRIETSFAQLFADLLEGIFSVVAERDANNNAASELLPAVTPQRLIHMRGAHFAAIMMRFKARLERNGFDEAAMQRIEDDFSELRRAYRKEPALEVALNAMDDGSSFVDSWKPLNGRFLSLLEFSGGIASIFPKTSRVEADFSTIKREKNVLRQSLSDFSLEGILHANQFSVLQALQ